MVRSVGKKSTIVINHPKKRLQLLDSRGRGRLPDDVDSFRQRRDAVFVDFVAEKFDGRLSEDAFCTVNYHAVLFEYGENVFEIIIMLIQRLGRDEYIVYIHKYPGYVA